MKESIRRILIEEFKLIPFVKRRLNYVNEYIDALIPSEVCEYWTVDEVDEYVNGAMSEIVRNIIDYSSGITSDEYSSVYDGIYEILVNLDYLEQIRDFFYDSMDNCGEVLREETIPTQIRRRLDTINRLIDVVVNDMYVCEYDDENHFIEGVVFETFDLFRNNEFGLNELDWMDVYEYLKTYRTDDIKEYFNERKEGCVDDLNESITGITPTDTVQQLINKPVKLIGDVNTNTMIQNVNVNKDGSVNITFKNGMNVNTSLPMLRTFNVGVSIPLEFKIKKKTIVTESNTNNEKSLKSLENTVQKFINMNLDDYKVPSDLYDLAVDITNDSYGRLECDVSFLFKKPFSSNDSNKLHHILKEIKKEIVNYFGDTFYHIRSGVSTVDMYNDSKSRDKK